MFTAPLPSDRILPLRDTDNIENISTVLLTAFVCVGLFTEVLPGNALIKSVKILREMF
jgi:hypothetical protein